MSDELEAALQELEAGGEARVYLVVGEEFLVRKTAEALLEKLLPGGQADLNLVVMDSATPKDVAVELATFPMFGGRKVVLLRDPEFLAPKKGRVDALSKARDAWKANRRKEAARRVLALAAKAGWGVAQLDPQGAGAPTADDWDRELGVTLAEADFTFLAEVGRYCAEEGLTQTSGDDAALTEWLKSKPGKGQVLVVATSSADARHPFVKLVKEHGRLIDRKVTGKLKDLDLTEFVTEALAPHKKKLAGAALEKLKDRVGSNFRLLQSELEKLALHSEGATITARDVELLVGHAREEEYLELSDALQKRDYAAAAKYVHESLAQGAALLMLSGAIASIVRTLVVSHERAVLLTGGKPPRSYNDFQARVWKQVEAEAKANKSKVPHPYAAFMGMQAATSFSRQELLGGLSMCAEADLALKFGGDVLVLERLLWTLCARVAPRPSSMHTIRKELER